MSRALDQLVPELRDAAAYLVEEARANGLGPIITSTRRTYAEQKALYEKFIRGQSAYPASPPGMGSHETGEAFDLVLADMDYLDDLGDLWESWGGRWGGNWKNPDRIHFELMGASERARAAWQARQAEDPYRWGFGNVIDLLDPRFGLGRSKLWDWAQQQAGIRG